MRRIVSSLGGIAVTRVRTRRHRSFFARTAHRVVASTLQVWDRISRRPVDAVAIITAAGTGLVIVVNALFLQSSTHNAPLLDPGKTNSKSDSLNPVAANNPAHPIVASPPLQPGAARRRDPIAAFIRPPP